MLANFCYFAAKIDPYSFKFNYILVSAGGGGKGSPSIPG